MSLFSKEKASESNDSIQAYRKLDPQSRDQSPMRTHVTTLWELDSRKENHHSSSLSMFRKTSFQKKKNSENMQILREYNLN